MRASAVIGAATLLVAVFVAIPRAYPQEAQAARSFAALIASFDECIQERFRDLSGKSLGLARVTPASPHAFFAHNVREESAVQYLDAARLNVVMYVGGRKLLGEDGYSITPQRGALVMVPGRNGARLEGPIVVTPLSYNAPPQNAPRAATLMTDATKALRGFDRVDTASFSVEGWNIAATPIRARSNTCLGCHRLAPAGTAQNRLRIGDALGVALYAYQERH